MSLTHFALPLCLVCAWIPNLYAQIPARNSARTMPTDKAEANKRVTEIIIRAEEHFKKGKLNLADNKRLEARDEFDKAVDLILESGMDVRADYRLFTYYQELVERIYREETPSHDNMSRPASAVPVTQNQQTATRAARSSTMKVRAIAGDTIAKVAERYHASSDEVARLNGFPVDAQLQAGQEVRVPLSPKSASPQVGFREQRFEPSMLDELSKSNPSFSISGNACSPSQLRNIEIRGFSLGMLLNEFLARTPGVRVPQADDFGLIDGYFSPSAYPAYSSFYRKKFNGVGGVAYRILDNRLIGLMIVYDDSIKWNDAGEFLSRISESLKLPFDWIQTQSLSSDYAMQCGSTHVGVKYRRGISPALFILDIEAHRRLARRQAEQEEKKRRTFKP